MPSVPTFLTLVVLPVLPDHGYGPYAALNPYQIWLMVVLMVGVSLTGYAALRLLGERRAVWTVGHRLQHMTRSRRGSVSFARPAARCGKLLIPRGCDCLERVRALRLRGDDGVLHRVIAGALAG